MSCGNGSEAAVLAKIDGTGAQLKCPSEPGELR